jgi:hypothetical protein
VLGSLLHLLVVSLQESVVDSDLRWSQCWGSNELKAGVADELSGQPQEGLLEVVVGLGRNVVVLEVLLAVESDGLGLDLTFLNIDLVTGQDDRDVLANSDEVTWGEVDVIKFLYSK